jgi:hypothetical protein
MVRLPVILEAIATFLLLDLFVLLLASRQPRLAVLVALP